MKKKFRPIFVFVLLPALSFCGCKVPLDDRQAVVEVKNQVAGLEKSLEESVIIQQALKKQVEDLQRRFDEARDQLLKQDQKIRILMETESGGHEVRNPGGKLVEEAKNVVEPLTEMPAALPGGAHDKLYDESLAAYRNGDYETSVKLFAAYLRDFPEAPRAANARYWLGESYYSLAQYAQAISEFKRVQSDFPKSSKVPDALLKIAMSFQAIGGFDAARAAYAALIQKYPASTSAAKAEKALADSE
ncbi:MAG: tol-pal system protein YbgF [Deltaproteobacteria bacterium]|nr:tol-pal system protein YbgF [Deltaproteobacteria bacterium]